MGLSMMFAIAPMCEMTDERKNAVKAIIKTLVAEDFEDCAAFLYDANVDEKREQLFEYVVEVCGNYEQPAKDVGWLRIDPVNYLLGITGAPSHGDSPTDSYDAFNAVSCIEQVFDQLTTWAIEDSKKAS
jgi:hypothetical protein